MKVILNQTVPKVGKEGQVVSVADGFARNYLFPRGLAIYADKNQVKALERRMERVAVKEAGTVSSAECLKEKLDGQTVRIEGKVGKETGKLFGAITSQDVVDAIKDQLGHTVEKKNVALIEPIKRLGKHPVHLDLHRQVDAIVNVVVFDPSIPEETEEAPAEAESTVEASDMESAPEPEPVEA
jgi:large subunit ribosomal protein L9